MKKMFSYFLTRYRYLFLIYLVLSTIIFFKLLLSEGGVSGGDWSFPANFDQLKILFTSLGSSWTYTGNIFGYRQLAFNLIILVAPAYLIALSGLTVSLIFKIFLILIFALAASNMNLFIRYIGLKPITAFIVGFIFILTPIFFNYSLMGWTYVLLSLALLPLFIYLFLRAIDEKKYYFALLGACVFSIATLQSQTIIWYPLALILVIIGYCRGRQQLSLGIKYFFLVVLAFLALNLYWLPQMLILPDAGVSGSQLVWAADSVGTSYRLISSNIIKLWGSLFNFQFETSYPKFLWPVSYIIPIMAFSALFYWKRYKRHLSYLILIFLVLVLFYTLDRSTIAKLPFSNLIRDIARFTTLSTFALTTMVAITLDQLFLLKIKSKNLIIMLVLMLLLLNTLPFFTGEFFSGRVNYFDFRFRTKEWPTEYDDFNKKLAEEKDISRPIFLPTGGMISLTDDQRYNGPASELTDVYASYAPIPSLMGTNSRGQGPISELGYQIDKALRDQDFQKLESLAKMTGIDLLVFRRNIQFYDWNQDKTAVFESKLRKMVSEGVAETYYDQGSIFAIKIRTDQKLFYSQNKLTEVKSNYQKILASYIGENVISKNDFLQINNLEDLKDLYGNDIALTFDDQNASYSKYVSENPSVYQFFSLESLAEKAPMTAWWLRIKNLDELLDQGLKNGNNQAIEQLKRVNIGGKSRNEYLVFADKEINNAKVYAKDDLSTNFSSIKINGADFIFDYQAGKLKVLNNINLKQGINTFQTSNNITPVFVVNEDPAPSSPLPVTNFKRIGPAKYQLDIRNIKADFVLNFGDNYNPYWRLTDSKGFFSQQIITDNNHFVSNGYGNGFNIQLTELERANLLRKENDGSYSAQFTLEYLPQRYLVVGSILSGFTLLIILFIPLAKFRRRHE